MKIRSLSAGFVLGIVAACIAGAAFMQQDRGQVGAAQPPQQPAPEEMQRMMKQWADSIAVGDQHRNMAKLAGKYNTVTRIWMAGPDQPPQEFKGTSEMKVVLGGRFLQQTDHSEMILPNPKTGAPEMQPMEGIGLFGYDNFQRMYVGCWASSSGTQLLNLRGTMTPDGKRLTLYAEMDEPMLDVRGRLIKAVTEYVNDDTHLFTVYDLAVDDDYRVFQIEYTRVK